MGSINKSPQRSRSGFKRGDLKLANRGAISKYLDLNDPVPPKRGAQHE
jgi:hypothetical protein